MPRPPHPEDSDDDQATVPGAVSRTLNSRSIPPGGETEEQRVERLHAIEARTPVRASLSTPEPPPAVESRTPSTPPVVARTATATADPTPMTLWIWAAAGAVVALGLGALLLL